MSMILYIFGILGALCVQPYTNIKILTYISLIINESVNFVKNCPENSHFFTFSSQINDVLLTLRTCNCIFY